MVDRIVILSFRSLNASPAMCCVVEFENVLVRDYGGELVTPPQQIEGELSNTLVICIGLNFSQVYSARKYLMMARDRGAKVALYVFDCWDVKPFFYSRRSRLKRKFQKESRLYSICDRLFVPFEAALNDFHDRERALVRHLPLGVDTSLCRNFPKTRPISVLGYGRQDADIDQAFSRHFNSASSTMIYYHTRHIHIPKVNDFDTHRRFFWNIARNSVLALTYDPSTIQSSVPYSIVGQRWFECMAAGCVIVGRRPRTPEADALLDWEHSTIDLPDDPSRAVAFAEDLLRQERFLDDVRERNLENVRARHDWRNRIEAMLLELYSASVKN